MKSSNIKKPIIIRRTEDMKDECITLVALFPSEQ